MAAPTSRLRPLSLLPRAANSAHLRPLFPLRPLLPPLRSALSAFPSSSPENGGLGSDKTHSEGPEGTPSPRFEQRLLPQRKEAALIERARELLTRPPADWHRSSALLAALTPTQAARVATSHPDAASALELLHFLSREHSHKYLPDTFSTLAFRLLNTGHHPAAGRARIHMIKSCRNQAEMMRSMDDLDTLSRRGAKMGLFAYGTLLIHLSRFNMTATVMDRYHQLLREGLQPNLLIYNAVINALCKAGNVRHAVSIMNYNMPESGVKPNTFTYTSIVLGYCKNKDLVSALEIFNRMDKEGCKPNVATYSTLINGLCSSGRVNLALGMITEMSRRGVLPTPYTFAVPIATLCGMGCFGDAWKLFVDMKKIGCRPNVYTYTSLIGGQRVSRMAIGLFHRMARDGVLPNTVTYNMLMNVLVEDRKMDSAIIVYNVMHGYGCLPDTETYNILIKGYCTIGNVDKAMCMLTNMLEGRATPTPTLVTYKTIIKGYCDSGNTAAALKILGLMKFDGHEPDEWSYTELILGFCKMTEMESAYKMFNEMVDHGFCPNEVIYTALISGYCKDEKLECATRMFEHMKISGCRPNVQTYNVLIHGLTKHNNFSAAEKLCEVMFKEKISPNVVTYTTMIDGLCENGDTSLALEMFNRMVEQNCLPNLDTYGSLIQALGQEGKVEEAEELFSELVKQGLIPDEVTYAKMIRVYIMSGKVDRAFDFLRKMVTAGCQPTLCTYDVLIEGLRNEYLMVDQKLVAYPDAISDCSFDDQVINKHAISALSSKLAELDLGLSQQLYDAVLSGLSRSSRWFEAEILYRRMVGQGLCPNQETYNYFIISLLRALKIDLAMDVFSHMSAQRRQLHLAGYKELICALCQLHRRNEAQIVFEDMLTRNFNSDDIVWTVLINGLLGAGIDLCMEFLHIMEENNHKPSSRMSMILAREALKE